MLHFEPGRKEIYQLITRQISGESANLYGSTSNQRKSGFALSALPIRGPTSFSGLLTAIFHSYLYSPKFNMNNPLIQ